MAALHWWLQRVSGLLLVIFAGVHVAMQYALLPITLTGVPRAAVNGGLLALVVYHGVVGLNTIVDDYVRPIRLRRAVRRLLWVGAATLLFYGATGLRYVLP